MRQFVVNLAAIMAASALAACLSPPTQTACTSSARVTIGGVDFSNLIAAVEPSFTDWNAPSLVIELSPEGRLQFFDLTKSRVGKTALFEIDGNVVFEPVVQQPVESGEIKITGAMTVREVEGLAERICPARN